jgi:hypothetical protein
VGAAEVFTPESHLHAAVLAYALPASWMHLLQAQDPQDGGVDGVAADEDDDMSLDTQIKLHLSPPFGAPQLSSHDAFHRHHRFPATRPSPSTAAAGAR